MFYFIHKTTHPGINPKQSNSQQLIARKELIKVNLMIRCKISIVLHLLSKQEIIGQ